jgi:hypothetical protein
LRIGNEMSVLPAFSAPAFTAYAHHAGSVDWITHMVISSVVHGLVYGVIFHVMRGLSTGQAILLAVVVIGALWLWNRNRGYRG